MDDETMRTLRAFNKLSDKQKKEFLDATKGFEIKGRIDESITKNWVSMGPLPGACPYCGRS
ncbi:hypothetical protein [Bradyrhizobium sp. HKCCYLRH3083]|uniref:hypothetical protein n=1 Tax=unclassified Bradyrhizobium TaxID=2631580 RepID=UPI003EB8E73D